MKLWFSLGDMLRTRVFIRLKPRLSIWPQSGQGQAYRKLRFRSIGVTKRTLLNWQHGRRRPAEPAQVLLTLLAKCPSLVSELLL